MTRRTTALRYARALLDVAIAEADPVSVETQLAAATDVFISHAGLWKVMTNPAVGAPKKRAVVDSLLPQLDVSPVLQKTLQMLASRDRIALLPDLLEAYRSRLLDHQKVVRADIRSAVALPADRVQKLQQELAALTGRTVVMTSATDPSIIGGVVAQIGSTVYDGSIKRQLEKMRERLTGETR
jgi:F-type H+-transporting ATPase subunit delta